LKRPDAPIGEGGRTLMVNWPALLKQGAVGNELR
jgi:hypothetical protein